VSDELRRWLDELKPQVLYTILGSPGYIDLVNAIQRVWDIPVVVHFMDDGLADPRKPGLFSVWVSSMHRVKLRGLLARTSVGMAIGPHMAAEYERRYRMPFLAFQNTVDIAEWDALRRPARPVAEPARLLYSGSLFRYAQVEGLADCCRAVETLVGQGRNIRVQIRTPLAVYGTEVSRIPQSPSIAVGDVVGREQYMRDLVEADVLLLPVSFDRHAVHHIRLSMPSKLPEYLASGTPILVYGPPEVAQVRYAREHGWGYVVDERDPARLCQAIAKLIEDQPLRRQLTDAAARTVRAFHDATQVRARFQSALCSAAAAKPKTCP
jgi:glycosyltransferase involved in cell wall biosynthesis